MAAPLARELEVFRRVLPALLADAATRGRYALVHGDAVAADYPTFEAALQAGYDRFGLEPFLVKQVTDREEAAYFSRNVVPCP